MKIDIKWIEPAQQALIDSHIVDANGFYPKAYKGYISSLGASIVQSGLLPALSIYESDNFEDISSADNNRALLIYAIALLLQNKELLPTNINLLLNHAITCTPSDKAKLQRNINRALIAIKLAIRIYKPISTDIITRRERVPSMDTENRDVEESIIVNYDYTPHDNLYSNVGWLFYKNLYRYFRHFQYKDKNEKDITVQHEEELFKQKIGTICHSCFQNFVDSNNRVLKTMSSQCGFSSFTLRTTYPGLLIGAGLSHGVKNKGDIKIGFQFDYTTGLPYIPGSSIKGVLRSVFPDSNIQDKEYNDARISYLSSLLSSRLKISNPDEITNEKLFLLGRKIFQENGGVFMDALISEVASDSHTKKDYFIDKDYITPHKNPLGEPVPIQFLKVLPEVTYTFTFRLNEGLWLNPEQLLNLFQEILKDVGIGAKTNVGYGHLQ